MMISDVSLIIPSQNAEKNLFQLLRHLVNWEIIPSEIIIIDSSRIKLNIPNEFKLFTEKKNIRLLVVHERSLYPGHARNIGINKATNSILAFLDTSTHPTKKWLSSALHILQAKGVQGVWGNTYYKADTYIASLIRASTYGSKPLQTLPGSVVEKNIFNRCGLFIESTRAGEDGDWMSRTSLHKIKLSNPEEVLNYGELDRITIGGLLKKWFRNYSFSGKLPHRRTQKDLYYYLLSFVTVLIAYNWNKVIAAWDTESVYFIPNVTKISLLVIIFIYVAIRGILLPKKKGIDCKFIFPMNFIFIAAISFLIDATKALAFGYSRFRKND